jgi:predicted DsbA family dithiol-disulfide isomerase
LSPVCGTCYLFWKNRKPWGEDVEFRTHYVCDEDHGGLPVRLLIVARAQGGEVEAKTLNALFSARFEAKVNTEDEDIVDALAASLGFGEAWLRLKRAPETERQFRAMVKSRQDRGVERAPHFIINQAIVVSGGTCRCTGDELPAVLADVLQKLRAYRAAPAAK